jgi:hypothetical protein
MILAGKSAMQDRNIGKKWTDIQRELKEQGYDERLARAQANKKRKKPTDKVPDEVSIKCRYGSGGGLFCVWKRCGLVCRTCFLHT